MLNQSNILIMKKNYILNFLILVSLFAFSISLNANANNDIKDSKAIYTVTFSVTDTDGNPIDDAVITFGENTYPAGQYSFDVEENNYGYFVNRYGYVEEDEAFIDVDGPELINVQLTPSVELEFDGTTIDFSWNEQIGTFDAGIIINLAPYNTDGVFVMLKLYDDEDNLLIFSDVFEEFSIGNLHYHSGTSDRIFADFTGAQSEGIWGTRVLSDNPTAGGSLRGTALNGALFYGVMIDATVGTVGIVTPSASGSDDMTVAYLLKDGVYGEFTMIVEVFQPFRPGAVGSAGFYTLAELEGLEPLAGFEYEFANLLDPIVINTQPASQTICTYDNALLEVAADVNNGETLLYQWYHNTELLTGEESATLETNVAGEYYCVLTAGTDELTTETATVNVVEVNPVLDAEIQACDGTNVQLDPGVFVGYEWQDLTTDQMYHVTSDGTYSVTVTGDNGCTASASSEVTFFEEVEIAFEDTVILCAGSSLTLAAPLGDTYEWGEGEDTQEIEVTEEGWYYLTVTIATCSGNDSTYVQVVDIPEAFDLGADVFTCEATYTIQGPEVADVDYLWSTTEETQNIEVTETGTYTLHIINEHGCETSDEIMIEFGSELVFDLHETDTIESCNGSTVTLNPEIGVSWVWSTGMGSSTIDVTETDWYNVTITGEFGCVGEDSVYVHFNNLPAINLGNDQEYCADETITISAPNAVEWLWSTDETTQNITITETGEYSCMITDENGCQNADTIEITVFPIPSADLGPDATIQANQTLIIGVPEGQFSYDWNTGAETSHILIDGAQLSTGNHNYSITVTNIHGCQNSDAITITVVPVNDIDQNIAGKISITPNPTNGIININGQNINNVSIYDNIGKLLISTKNSSIDLSKYPSGMYFVKIATNENTSTYKVVKQ